MVWSQLSADKPHVAYAVIAVFGALFSLCSLFVKEKLYLGEAPVATVYGLIVGPHCLNWFNPLSWGNYLYITLEISRVLLCIEIVAVAVELPKKYIWKHWFSVFLLLIPCMTAGWLIVGVFTYLIIPGLHFTHGLLIAACVTATDPVLAQAVVGKGKFARRVPAHLRNLLSAESACNDGVSVPFVYLSLNLILHAGNSHEIAKEWICVTVLYECGFGCILGIAIGYLGRRFLKFAESRDLIDHESFLAFYIILALLCAGFGSVLGVDDLLASFCAGSAFAWDGWFTQKTEESQISTVIDILLNMSYFVYFGSIIPWADFNNASLGLNCWRLICLALVVIFLRRIPAVMITKLINPDIKDWKEALFVGHFGPIGVGAVFAAIIAIGDLESDVLKIHEGPTTFYPEESEYFQLIRVVFPIVCFLIVTSIIVHGSSVAVMTLGKQLQTMTFTMTFTKVDTETAAGGWTSRLPKLERSGTSYSLKRIDTMALVEDEEEEEENAEKKENDMFYEKHHGITGLGLEHGKPLSSVPTIETSGVPVKPAGGMRRRRQRKKLQKLKLQNKHKNKKRPPVSETLDLRSLSRHDASSSNNNESESHIDENLIGRHETEASNPQSTVITSAESDNEADDEKKDTAMIDRLPNGEKSLLPVVHADPQTLERLDTNYELKESDLQPRLDEDGQMRFPTRGYADANKLIIEDQHGEILRTVRSRADSQSVHSENTVPLERVLSGSSLRSRAESVSHNLASRFRLGRTNTETSSSTKDIEVKATSPETLSPSLSSGEAPVLVPPISVESPSDDDKSNYNDDNKHHSPERKPPTTKSRFTKILDIGKRVQPSQKTLERGLLHRSTKSSPFRPNEHVSQKFHGYRVNDTIIIENNEGEIVGRYKINIKKQQARKRSNETTEELDNDTISRTLRYFGLKKEKEQIDEELNEMSNSELIPESNDLNDAKLENKLKHFINADPKKAVVIFPSSDTKKQEDSIELVHNNKDAGQNEGQFESEEEYDNSFDDGFDDDDDDDYDDDYEYNSQFNYIPGESEYERVRRLAALAKSKRTSDDEEEEPKTKY